MSSCCWGPWDEFTLFIAYKSTSRSPQCHGCWQKAQDSWFREKVLLVRCSPGPHHLPVEGFLGCYKKKKKKNFLRLRRRMSDIYETPEFIRCHLPQSRQGKSPISSPADLGLKSVSWVFAPDLHSPFQHPVNFICVSSCSPLCVRATCCF